MLNPGGAKNDVCIVLQSVAEVDDFSAGIAHGGPGLRNSGLVSGEECKVHAFQMLRQDSLNERWFVIDLLKLAEHFLFIQQLEFGGGKAALAEYVADFLALEGSGTDQSYGEEI